MFGYEEGAPGNLGAVGSEPAEGASFSWLPVPNTICLVGSLLGHTTIPYLRQSSFISLRRKFGHRGSLSISLVFCRVILIAGWYCNLKSHPQASVPRPPVDTVATQWHRRILSDSSSELEDQTASSYQGCISRVIFHLKDSHDREGKEKRKKTNRLSEGYPTQYCCNLRARRPRVRMQIPRHDLLEIESPGRLRRDVLPRIGSLGR